MTAAALQTVPDTLRARGGVRLVVGQAGGRSAPLVVAESAGYRIRFPRTPSGECEGVLLNTGGGLAGGDRMGVEAVIGAGAAACLTNQAAEKVYRADGAAAEIAVSLVLEPGSRLAWLPQEQILFDGARLKRRLAVEMAADSALTLVEGAVFGRIARGETVETGALRDSWRIRRAGRLVFAEAVRLEGRVRDILARGALGGGAAALATGLHVAPDAERHLEPLREALAGAPCEWGASAFDGMLLARFLGRDPQAVRTALARFVTTIRGSAPPRSWQT